MCLPRYDQSIHVHHHTLTLARVGVHRRVWGYPTLDPNKGIEAYNSSLIYEGQVHFSIILTYLVIIKANEPCFS